MGASEADGERGSDGGQIADNAGRGGEAWRSGTVMQGAGGRMVATGHVSEKHAAFCWRLAHGDKQTEAARKAGYEFPAVEASRLIRDARTMPLVMQFRGSRWLELEGGALATLWEIMNDKGQPAGERRGAARELLQAAKEMRTDTAAAQDAASISIPDGSGRGEIGGIEAIFAAFRMVSSDGTVTVDAQPIDVKQ